MGKLKLYGNGIYDDYDAIQELLDSGISTVYLPIPEKHYLISKPLLIHSNQTLKLDENTRVVLTDNANCCMVRNDDYVKGNVNITIDGGIWDMNHNNQWPNPYHFPDSNGVIRTKAYMKEKFGWTPQSGLVRPTYTGHAFVFSRVKNFTFKNITIVNPVVYGVQLSFIEYFTIENIRFDYYEGSPKLWNMDGIHLEAGCRFGKISNLKGACHDDLLALTSDDDIWGGQIENIEIDGIFAENCHSAIRFLSRGTPVKNISVKNIFGSFYVYGIIMSRYVDVDGERGKFENINIENVYASICPGTIDVVGNDCALIHIMSGLDMKNISFRNIVREENHCFLPTIKIYPNNTIDSLIVDGVYQTIKSGNKVIPLETEANIEHLEIKNIFGGECKIGGKIDKLICE